MTSTIEIINAIDVPTPSNRLLTNGGLPDRHIFEKKFDLEEENPSTILIEIIAYIHHADPITLEPLAETVDTDALNTLLTSKFEGDERPIEVCFSYEGLFICIRSDGKLWVRWDD